MFNLFSRFRKVAPAAYENQAPFPTGMLKALDRKDTVHLGLETYIDKRKGPSIYDVICMYLCDNLIAVISKSTEQIEHLNNKLLLQ
ncbi:MAG: hypothetical protein AAFV80_07200, partial [Bacteroidota bacterium]